MGDGHVTGSWSFVHQVVAGRWFSVFASFMIMIGAGATYMFGTYSNVIKTHFDYTQTQINMLGFAKDLGSNFGVIAGLLAEVAPGWVLFMIGSVMNFISYLMIYLSVIEEIPRPSFWQMGFFIAMATNSQNFANTAVLVSNVQNFPDRRGIILGLIKGFVGLGGAILTQFYLAVYGSNDPEHLILLLAWFPSVVSLVLMFSIRKVKVQYNPNELTVFYQFLHISILLALVLMSLTITQKLSVFSHGAYITGAIVILVLLCLPLLIAIREEFFLLKSKTNSTLIHEQRTPNRVTTKKLSCTTDEFMETPRSCFSNVFNKPERGEDFTILQAVLSTDMAFLFVATLCGTGSTIATIDNLGQICESLSYPAPSISIFISLVSILNFFGRTFSGFISEALLLKYKFPRPLMFSLFHLVTTIGQLFIAYPFPGSVYIASLIIGFAFGAQVPLLFAIISELFGLKHYSTLFNCGQLAVPIGSYLLNVEVIGRSYDRQAKYQGAERDGSGLTCVGYLCFARSFKIMAAVTFFGGISSLVLAFRTRDFYKGDIYKRFREDIWIPETNMEFYCLDDNKKKKERHEFQNY